MVEREVDLRSSTGASVVGPPRLAPRGPLSAWLIEHLARPVHRLPAPPPTNDDPLVGEDSALALYLCYELHYRGLPGVDDAWEWEPSLLGVRRQLEESFLDRLVALVGRPDDELSPLAMREELVRLATTDGGPSLSAYMAESGTTEQLREFCVHRSLYQLKEADPHTFAVPRLWGPAKAAMVAIQVGEYGDGRADRVHAHLFGETMTELGLDPAYGAYLPVVPATTLATVNLVSYFGLHRRWRGAAVGHLALFEMCSVVPMGRYASGLRRLGFGEQATDFYDEHVVADEVHQVIALDEMAMGLAATEPRLAGTVTFGARAVKAVEDRFARALLGAWEDGRTSLLAPLPDAAADLPSPCPPS
jgi:hypothetical protein